MKSANKSAKTEKNFDQLISKFSEKEILDLQAMSYIRGGAADGEGNGSEPIVIVPKF